ncbi:MAG: hypothetical protein KDE47_27500, partial [Caldilineaceae bacterium]|nr:hypothetical protein [Caldilineaceae bacterium]
MRKEYTIVDTDIHPGVPADRILPRLAQPWRMRLEQGNRSAGALGYWNPNGVNRPDAVLEDGTRIENSPRALADHWLTPNQIDFGILNCGSVLHLGLSPEADYAIALISAINDVIVEEWLAADPRYRASIAVYPYDIDAAVREIQRLGDHPG